jgi:hypothetical protein
MARKTEIYSWRVSRALKVSLEEVARAERRTVAQLLDAIVAEHLEAVGTGGRGEADHSRRSSPSITTTSRPIASAHASAFAFSRPDRGHGRPQSKRGHPAIGQT